MKLRNALYGLSAIAVSAAICGPVSAQTLDYDSLSGLFGEPVTAGATGAPQRASDVPATMVIITREDIQRAPEYDIPGLLRHYAGVNFNRYSYGDGQVSIRGAATGFTPRLLVLVNGREVYLDSYGYTAWSTIPVQLEEIQQIEVVKGAQSALYGFNAVPGVVNIITRNPQHGNYAEASATAGSQGNHNVSLVAAHAFNDAFSVRFSYADGEADELEPVAANTYAVGLSGQAYSRETGALEARFNVTDKVSVTAEYTLSEVAQNELTSIFYATRSLYDLNSFKVDVEADTEWGFITLSGYRNESEISYDFGPLSAELTAFRAEDLFKIGTNDTVRFSVEYREGNTASFPDPGYGDFGYESTAFSAMWNHKFSNAMDLTLAGRFDSVDWSRDGSPDAFFYPFSQSDYSVSYEEFSYNAALVWRPSSGGAVRFMAGRGVQAPTMFDIGFTTVVTVGGIPLAVSGNPDIDTSIVTNYEIAYDRDFSNGISFRGAVFYNDTQDVRGIFGLFPDILPPTSNVPTLLFDNRGDTTVTGAEITLAGEAGENWDWDINYTHQSVSDDLAVFPLQTSQDFEGVTPERIINAHLGWSEGRFTADAFVNYVSGIDSPIQPEFGTISRMDIDDQMAISLHGGWAFTDNVEFSVSAQNINFGNGEVVNVNYENEAVTWATLRVRR